MKNLLYFIFILPLIVCGQDLSNVQISFDRHFVKKAVLSNNANISDLPFMHRNYLKPYSSKSRKIITLEDSAIVLHEEIFLERTGWDEWMLTPKKMVLENGIWAGYSEEGEVLFADTLEEEMYSVIQGSGGVYDFMLLTDEFSGISMDYAQDLSSEGITLTQHAPDLYHLHSADMNVFIDKQDYSMTSITYDEEGVQHISHLKFVPFNGAGFLLVSNVNQSKISDDLTVLSIEQYSNYSIDDEAAVTDQTSINFSLYPNPAEEYLNIFFEDNSIIIEEIIFSNLQDGQRTIVNGNHTFQQNVDLNNIVAGYYSVSISTQNHGDFRKTLIIN